MCDSLFTFPQTIGEGGIAFDSAEKVTANGKLSKHSSAVYKQISYGETKSMDSDDSLNDDGASNCFTICHKGPMKIGIPCFQVMKEEKDKICEPSIQRISSSRRSIDCGQDCPICWESFKVKEKVCWSRNVNCR
jgi:hypothetical protein